MIRFFVALLLLSMTAPLPAATSPRSDEIDPAAGGASSLDQLIARRLVQHCARFVQPGPDEDPQAGYRAALGILAWAATIAPEDVEIHRRIAAAGAVLDADLPAVVEGERQLLRLEPRNAIAQLRVINRAIDERQSVAERVELCERLLRSSAAARLAPAVLSHIAYRAATLAQEQGRATVASTYLDEALRYNPTNLDAAGLNALEIDRQTTKVELLVRAMVTLVKADPTNAAALSDLIAVVQQAGHHQGAADLIEVMSALAARQGESIPDDLFADYAFLRCAGTEPSAGLDLIIQRQASFDRFERRRLQTEWLREQQAAKQKAEAENRTFTPPAEMPTYEEVSVDLSLNLQLTRALLAMASGDAAEVDRAISSLERQWAAALIELRTADRAALPASAVRALEADERRVIADRAWSRLWLNRQIDEAAADLAALEESGLHDPDELERLRGWLTLRRGEAESAIVRFKPHEGVDPMSDLGMAQAQIELGRIADATRLLGEVYQAQPGRLVGVLCKWEYEKLTGRAMPATRAARTVEKELGRVPNTLSDMLLRPQRYFSLTVAPRVDRADPLDDLIFDVTLRNDGAWAVAIGPDKILPSRLALFPIFHISGRRVQTGTPPLSIDLQRQLVLMPASSVTVPVAIDHTLFGLLIPSLAIRPMTVGFQAMLDYQINPDGKFAPRPWSLVRQSKPTQITPWPGLLGAETVDLAARLSTQDTAATTQAISEIGSVLHARLARTVDPEANSQLFAAADAAVDRLIELWPELDRRIAAWAVLSLPFQKQSTANRLAALDRFEAVARGSADPLVQLAWIAARAGTESDVVIEAAMRGDHVNLRAIATDVRLFLTAPTAEGPTPQDANELPVK